MPTVIAILCKNFILNFVLILLLVYLVDICFILFFNFLPGIFIPSDCPFYVTV